jgi:transcriptional regulator with XRE-family HTH domain
MARRTILQRLREGEHTQAEVAAMAGYRSRGHASDIYHGHKAPSLGAIVRLADALGCSDSEIGLSVRQWAKVEDGQ